MRIQVGDYMVRSYKRADAPTIAKHANNLKIAANLRNAFPNPYTLKDAKEWLRLVRHENPERNFAIANENEVIGGIGLILKEDVYAKNAEIGYWLGEDFWGKGIMTGLVEAFTAWAFQNFDIMRIYASVFASNASSARVLEKAGYTFEARLKNTIFKNGQYQDDLIYSILKDS